MFALSRTPPVRRPRGGTGRRRPVVGKGGPHHRGNVERTGGLIADPPPPDADPAPRPARLRDLLSYLTGHRRVLGLVLVVSVLAAALSLAQPVVVNRVLTAVGLGEPYGDGVAVLVALVVGAGVLGAVQQYLLERTARGRGPRPRGAACSAACCACRSPSTTCGAPATWSPASARTRP